MGKEISIGGVWGGAPYLCEVCGGESSYSTCIACIRWAVEIMALAWRKNRGKNP